MDINTAVGLTFTVAIWLLMSVWAYRKWMLPKVLANRARNAGGRWAHCEYGYPESQPHLCGLPGVHRGAAAIGTKWTDGPCSQCHNGRPRWISGDEVRAHQQRIADGWLKADGRSLPDLDVYQEAFKRGITPREVLAERVAGQQ